MISLIGRLPLSLRVPLMVVVLMLAVATIASQQVLSTLDRLQAARIRELVNLHVDALSVALGPHVLRNDIWEVYDVLARSARQTSLHRTVFSAVADTKGRILAATDPRRAPVDSPIKALSREAMQLDDLSVSEGTDRVKLLAPLVYEGRRLGQILTELDISDILAERSRTARLLIVGNALATLVLAVLGYITIRGMLGPVTRLIELMQRSKGRPTRIPPEDVPANDTEVARLMRTYNEMVDAVEAKAEAERRLAERERLVSLGRLSSSLAHEINNPLGGLLNATDTIKRYADRPDVVLKSAELLERGLMHMRDVSKATLDFNRMNGTDQTLAREDFDDLRLLIGPEVKHYEQTLDWTVQIGETTPGDLPAAPIRQIALNLLLNASKVAGTRGRIGFAARIDPDNFLRMSVADSGPGLDDDARKRLLGDAAAPQGDGVGLRVVHDLVAILGGRIDVTHSEKGAEIRISLPLSREGENAELPAC